MNTADTARVNWSWKQVESAKKAEATAFEAWMANPTTVNWKSWRDAEDRTAAARSVSDRTVKQVVMQNCAMRVW